MLAKQPPGIGTVFELRDDAAFLERIDGPLDVLQPITEQFQRNIPVGRATGIVAPCGDLGSIPFPGQGRDLTLGEPVPAGLGGVEGGV